jgi:hypothetical protein
MLEDDLGNGVAYAARSSDNNQFLSAKFELHRDRLFGLLEAIRLNSTDSHLYFFLKSKEIGPRIMT